MKQILQDLKTGRMIVQDLPSLRPKPGHVFIATHTTEVSAGTDRMLLESGRAGLIGKARQQPEKVRMVIDKMRTDGILQTFEAVMSKPNEPIPLGNSDSGFVLAVGSVVDGSRPRRPSGFKNLA